MRVPRLDRLRGLAVLVLVSIAAWAPAAFAHPVHATLAEMEWNAIERHYEVSLQLQREDVDRALRARRTTAKREGTSETEILAKLVAESLDVVFVDSAGVRTAAKLTPVGVESKPRVLWFFFTLDLGGHQATTIESRLFLTHSKTHLNTVVVTERDLAAKDPAEKIVRSHVFSRKAPAPWNVAAAMAAAKERRRATRREARGEAR